MTSSCPLDWAHFGFFKFMIQSKVIAKKHNDVHKVDGRLNTLGRKKRKKNNNKNRV